jgi:TetR/AcrR family transcriptional repressor of nem operon
VDDLCTVAGVTKGAFFHHFVSKEEMAIAAAQYFSDRADGLFSAAGYRSLEDPLDRLLGYVDLRRTILRGELPDFTCLLGTMVQETFATHPAIRAACEVHIWRNAKMVEEDIAEAMRRYEVRGSWTAESLALYTQGVIQGAFILAKANQSTVVAEECLDHLRRYLEMLFVRGEGAAPAVVKTKTASRRKLSKPTGALA